eukprot:UN02074
MWATCFAEVDACPLDTNYGSRTDTNTWTGEMDFDVSAQDFCPQVVDEIYVQGEIDVFVDDQFSSDAQPGINLFSNDHAYFEVTYQTASLKSGATNWGDDTLIEAARPVKIEMTVTMVVPPFQSAVDRSHGDVDPPNAGANDLAYTVLLCEATPVVYPYTTVIDNCFDDANQGWNAKTYLAFTEHAHATNNAIDMNEIAFSLRLDERVIPVDVPNNQAQITIMVESEVYYHGNNNPAGYGRRRRKLQFNASSPEEIVESEEEIIILDTLRQDGQMENNRVQTTIPVVSHVPDFPYCPLNPTAKTAGFLLDFDTTDLPSSGNAISKVIDLKYSLTQFFNVANWGDLSIDAVSVCSSSASCQNMYSSKEVDVTKFSSRETSSKRPFVRYLVQTSGTTLTKNFQTELTNNGALYRELFNEMTLINMAVSHCDEQLD